MGNNTSSTRKSTANARHNLGSIRKSSISNNNHHNLDEEFSDLILHEVKRKQNEREKQQQQEQQQGEGNVPHKRMPIQYHQFSNDLIEDELNELNDGMLGADNTDVTRSILPNGDFSDPMDIVEGRSISSELLRQARQMTDTPTPDLKNVDFTKIAVPQNMSDMQLDTSYVTTSVGNNAAGNKKDGKLVPVEVKWVNTNKEDIRKISIIGSFSNWRNVIRLSHSTKHENEFVTTIKLPLGVHKLLYIINNEYRVSDQLPTATDQEGIFFNWFEVLDEVHLFNHSHNQPNHVGASTDYDANIISRSGHDSPQTAGRHDVDKIRKKLNSFLAKASKDELGSNVEHVEYMSEESPTPEVPEQPFESMAAPKPYDQMASDDASTTTNDSNKYISYHDRLSSSFLADQQNSTLSYSSEIPEMFVNLDYFKNKSPNYELPEPPQLPAHLNNVLLNKMSSNHQQNHAHNIPVIPPTITNHQNYQQVQQIQSSLYQYQYQPPPSNSVNSSKRPPLRRADSSYYASNQEAYHLSIPNHVILNHLMTTSIRNDVLTVACITRYSGKFVTQIMHSPADV